MPKALLAFAESDVNMQNEDGDLCDSIGIAFLEEERAGLKLAKGPVTSLPVILSLPLCRRPRLFPSQLSPSEQLAS